MRSADLILIIIAAASLNSAVLAEEYRDPFYHEEKIDCDEKAVKLLNLLQNWQFKGVVQQHDNVYKKIWLTSRNQWLTASVNDIPNELLPWQIKRITFDKVIWKANLTNDCGQFILWTMQLDEKE